MKKIIIILCITLLVTGCSNNITLKDNYQIETIENTSCSEQITEYYISNNQKIYLSCITKINLYDDKNTITLKDYIEKNNYSIDKVIEEITSKLTLQETLWDGGTKIYKDTNEITKNGLTIIVCNTTDNNKDIYVGTSQMQFQSNFCKKNN